MTSFRARWRAPSLPLAYLLMGVALLLFGVRAWIAWDHPLPLGLAGDPLVVRTNKLVGWLHVGRSDLYPWSWDTIWPGLLWEWLPSALFGWGLWGWLRHASLPRRGARLPRRALPLLGFGWLLGLASLLCWTCFQGFPHVQDSIAQTFQAQIFAAGQAFAPAPRQPEFFQYQFLVEDQGRWYAQYPPGEAALLALGLRAGVPWLVNPLCGALSALFLYRAARRAYDAPTAAVALALFCASPFVWFMSAERMNHTGLLLWITVALDAFAPALARRSEPLGAWRASLGGLALGLAISTRPLCGAAAALPLLAAVCWPAGGRLEWKTTRALLCAGIGLMAGVLPLLVFNALTTGSPLRFGYQVQWGSSGWGFGQAQWGPPHTLARGLAHAADNWDAAARYLLEWPVPSLLPLAGLLFLRRRTRMDYALLATPAVVTLLYIPYFFQDLCLGPRFLYAAAPALFILTARGLTGLGSAWAARQAVPQRRGIAHLHRAAALCTLAGLLANLPVLARWYGSDFWSTGPMIVDAARARGLHRAIVFIRDYNAARIAQLRLRGVRWSTAQTAVTALDGEWLDEQIRQVDAAEGSPQERAAELEQRLRIMSRRPTPATRRRHPVWIDYRGLSSSLSQGFWANTPWPERQDVIYALHLDERNPVLMRAYPGRTAWTYDWDRATASFQLRPAPRLPAMGYGAVSDDKARPRKTHDD